MINVRDLSVLLHVQITLGPDEFVTGVHGFYGFYGYGSDGVTGFTIVTNLRTYGPFGVSDSIKEPSPSTSPS